MNIGDTNLNSPATRPGPLTAADFDRPEHRYLVTVRRDGREHQITLFAPDWYGAWHAALDQYGNGGCRIEVRAAP